jgi:hypothetical protein
MFAAISRVRIRPNTIVQYKGGGYDGCIWEWNYAYLDGLGKFHSIVATGYRGCRTFGELRDFLATTEYDLYELKNDDEIERFGRETPISHLLTVAQWFNNEDFDVTLTAVCDVCESQGSCAYCGEYVGADHINGDSGYCTGSDHDQRWCHERHPT